MSLRLSANVATAPEVRTAAPSSTDDCRRVVHLDEYGFEEIIEVCDREPANVASPTAEPDESAGVEPQARPTQIPQVERAEAIGPIDVPDLGRLFRHQPNNGLINFIGSTSAVDLTEWIRDRFVFLAGCPDAPADVTDTARIEAGENAMSSIPAADVSIAFRTALDRIDEADALCNQGDSAAWTRAYRDALAALDRASVLVDPGLRPRLAFPPTVDLTADATLLSSYAMAIYERFFWAVRGQETQVGSDFWFGDEQLGILQGVHLAPDSAPGSDVAFLGGSVAAGAFDSAAVSIAANLVVANYSISTSASDSVAEWTTDLSELNALAPALVWALSSHDLLSQCPTATDTGPQLLRSLAFQGSRIYRGLAPLDLVLHPDLPLDASPIRARAAEQFSQWPTTRGRVDRPVERVWTDVLPGNERENFVVVCV